MKDIVLFPSLRFPEFNDAWLPSSINDNMVNYKGGAPLHPKDFIEYSEFEVIPKKAVSHGGRLILDQKNGTYCTKDFFEKNKKSVVDSSYLITTLRDLVPSGPSIGYIVKFENRKLYLLAQGVYGFKISNKKLTEDFIIHFSNTDGYRKVMQTIMVGSTQVHIRNTDFFNISINIPSLPEQQKIAAFLTAVDKKIALLKRKKELLEQYKKGISQKIFSQEIRFKDDNGNEFPKWEEKKLEEIGQNVIGLTYSPKDIVNGDNGIIVLRSSNIKEDRLDLNDVVKVNVKLNEKLKIQNDDILVCTRNGSQRLIGKNILLELPNSQDFTFGAFMSVFRSPINRFMSHIFKTDRFKNQVQVNLGARINQITTGNLNKFTFHIPSSADEQHKIFNFLSGIDKKIDILTKQIKQTQAFKKGLLQQMFI